MASNPPTWDELINEAIALCIQTLRPLLNDTFVAGEVTPHNVERVNAMQKALAELEAVMSEE